MNVWNILALADFIESSPYEFDMGSVRIASCGTPGCVAGHAAVLWPSVRSVHWSDDWDEDALASKLGIEYHQVRDIIYPHRGDEVLNYELYTRKRAVAMLRRLAATGNVGYDLSEV